MELAFGIKFGQEKRRRSRNKKECKSSSFLKGKPAYWAEEISWGD
jgi:hypothetical protein